MLSGVDARELEFKPALPSEGSGVGGTGDERESEPRRPCGAAGSLGSPFFCASALLTSRATLALVPLARRPAVAPRVCTFAGDGVFTAEPGTELLRVGLSEVYLLLVLLGLPGGDLLVALPSRVLEPEEARAALVLPCISMAGPPSLGVPDGLMVLDDVLAAVVSVGVGVVVVVVVVVAFMVAGPFPLPGYALAWLPSPLPLPALTLSFVFVPPACLASALATREEVVGLGGSEDEL